MQTNNTTKAIGWKMLERFGVQGVQFLLQVILARLLDPEHYGVLSLMLVFTTLATVFVQSGFNTSLIQNKDVTEDDYSSVFWVTLVIAVAIYILFFFSAPLIAIAYKMPDIVAPFRVLALVLFPGTLNSIQIAKVSREIDFKKIFYSNIGAIVISGVAGIAMAYVGLGLWALVAQYILNIVLAAVIMLFCVKWTPKFVCDLKRVKVLFSFGWKLLVSNLINTISQDIRSLVIGLKYSSGTLGFYNRGKHFPQFLTNAINGAVQSVMLPVMAKDQDNKTKVKNLMRTSITVCSYLMFPIMAGLAGIATPLVKILLTDKWLPCVPYLQIYCFTFAFYPVHTCNLQTINAMGRSDVFLKLEIIKRSLSLIALAIALVFFDSPIAIASTGLFTALITCFINAHPNKKLVNYSYFEQMKDILPSFLVSLIMFVCVLLIGTLPLSTYLVMALQILCGMAIYIGVSAITKLQPFMFLLQMVKSKITK